MPVSLYRFRSLNAIILVLLFSSGSGVGLLADTPDRPEDTPGREQKTPSSDAPISEADEMRRLKAITDEIIARTNDFRAENDLESLSVAPDLTKAAAKFAKYMAGTDRYGHNADGGTPARRAEAAGYDYCMVRENIAYRTNTGEPTRASLTELFVQGWIDSPGHRENMLAEYATQTGVAVATDDGNTFYAVQLFGRPKSRSIEIQVTNRSEQTVTLVTESNGSRDEFAMQPRMKFKMRRCFPTTIQLVSSEETVTAKESQSLMIEDGPVLLKQTSETSTE